MGSAEQNWWEGKTLFITGGAKGIGAATVQAFLGKGASVCFVDRDESAAKAFLRKQGNSERLLYIAGDTRDARRMEEAAEEAVERFGGLDFVVSNAGIHRLGTILETDPQVWQELLDINLTGTYNTLRATLPHLIARHGGCMTLIGSDQSFIGKRRSFAYGATKGAIGQMAASLALDYAPEKIRVNCVCPGTIDTDLYRQAIAQIAAEEYGGDLREAERHSALQQPLGRIGTPQEVAAMVLFLASPEAGFITGARIPVDGGYTAQ
ncbi:SDR family NAD(P)-dependent oxidoreductase [Nitratifractor salsuginis]|uniref:Short-chain dehydrogenase/reductase SDR n=1 Tax=Nitratifractor salsuginis (strain DSM 16511 / JCM 12458 / E9I37-1) TaxID=749222 RepID=E6WZ73_NITSE|nr:SDR family oxidoreductase [Nitratifractor salsuginis]ADV46585.1 short-chain dehydrogenase/reductase SDR [Nitratifractor salsuginis DSM 16511]